VIKLKRLSSDKSGQVAIITAILIIAFVGMLALVIDMGALYEDRRELQSVADAAALAGAQELPEEPDTATAKAIEYVENNRPDISSINIQIGSYLTSNDMITVTVNNPDSPVYFGRVFGINAVNVGATATAIVGKPRGLSDVVPWGAKLVEGEDFNDWLTGLTEKTLKYGAGSSEEGNFYALDLDGSTGGGASDYYDRIVYGYHDYLVVGDEIWTEPGNMNKTATKVYERLEEYGDGEIHDFDELVQNGELKVNNGQFVMVPVIYELEHPTGEDLVEILAFAPFIITGVIEEGPSKGEITGKFVSQALLVESGGVDPVEPTGVRVIRLIK
jgi:hypothetical protein